MGLDMWFREDVRRILASTLEVQRNSSLALAPLDAEAAFAYQRGFVDALMAVAVAFGIQPVRRGQARARFFCADNDDRGYEGLGMGDGEVRGVGS